LRTRIISGTVIALLGAVLILFSETYLLNIVAILLIIGALREVFNACKIDVVELRFFGYLLAVIPLVFELIFDFCFRNTENWFSDKFFGKAVTLSELVQILAVFAIFLIFLTFHKKISYSQIFVTIGGAFLFRYSFSKLIAIGQMYEETAYERVDEIRVLLLILVLCAAALSDTGAYFVGVTLGKHKLCPNISPKKTVEGFIGGIMSNAILFPLIAYVFSKLCYSDLGLNSEMYIHFAVLGIICAIIGLLGDLSASALKREVGIKDFGKLIPGHGGILDRFDSLLFILPAFAYYAEHILEFKKTTFF
jgi:phosphatidate cytidylyltransferase